MQSIRKKSFAAEQLAKRQQKKNPVTIAVIVLAVVIAVGAVGYALYVRFGAKEEPTEAVTPPAEEPKYIAVLPFRDISPSKEQEHLGDGISEMIINALTQYNYEKLRVIASTSSFQYKDRENIISELGEKLGVNWVLEGTVLKEAGRIRVTAQLIQVEDETHIWSDKYDHDFSSVIAVQDTISLAILKEMKFTLLGDEERLVAKRYTNDPDAYELYLHGRYNAELGGGEYLAKAREYFLQAIDKDPDFALAYAGLARVSQREEQDTLLHKALELDENLGEAYAQLAQISLYYDWDFKAAEKNIKRALELNPGYPWAYEGYSRYLRVMGRYEEALEKVHRAQALNPLIWSTYGQAMSLYLRLGKYDDARAQFKKAVDINPENIYAKFTLARVDIMTGNYEKALEYYKEVYSKNPERATTSPQIARIHALSGNKEKAEEILQKVILNSSTDLDFYSIAYIYTALGDRDNAFKWLEKVYEMKSAYLIVIKSDPEWDPLHSDPRYKALLKKMGLPED